LEERVAFTAGEEAKQTGLKQLSSRIPLFLIGSFFNSEDRGCMFPETSVDFYIL
jgi:hypothetical protein